MMVKRNTLAAFLLATHSVSAFAESSPEAEIEACYNDAVQFDREPAECMADKEREYGDQLGEAYKKLLQIAGTHAASFRASQRAWLKYQTATCEAEERHMSREGRRISSGVREACLLRTTIYRLREIRKSIE